MITEVERNQQHEKYLESLEATIDFQIQKGIAEGYNSVYIPLRHASPNILDKLISNGFTVKKNYLLQKLKISWKYNQ